MPSQQERQQITALISRFEAATGLQAVAAVASKADAHAEIPWKAYAMGSAIGAVIAAFDPLSVSGWSQTSVIALDALIVLGTGVVLALIAMLVPAVGRLFLNRVRAHAEALHYAQRLFYTRELFRTQTRCAVLIVICRFERIGVVIADSGLARYAPETALREAASDLGRIAARHGLVSAFEVALKRVGDLLEANGFVAAPAETNEIADDVLVEKE